MVSNMKEKREEEPSFACHSTFPEKEKKKERGGEGRGKDGSVPSKFIFVSSLNKPLGPNKTGEAIKKSGTIRVPKTTDRAPKNQESYNL